MLAKYTKVNDTAFAGMGRLIESRLNIVVWQNHLFYCSYSRAGHV